MDFKALEAPLATLHVLHAFRNRLESLVNINDLAAWRALTKVAVSSLKVEAFLLAASLSSESLGGHKTASDRLSSELVNLSSWHVTEGLLSDFYASYLGEVAKLQRTLTITDAFVGLAIVGFRSIEEYNSPRAVMNWVIENMALEVRSFANLEAHLELVSGVPTLLTQSEGRFVNAAGGACSRTLNGIGRRWIPTHCANVDGTLRPAPRGLGAVEIDVAKLSPQHRSEARFQLKVAERELLVGSEGVANANITSGAQLNGKVGTIYFKSESAQLRYDEIQDTLRALEHQD